MTMPGKAKAHVPALGDVHGVAQCYFAGKYSETFGITD
jgi:hypothetical protein